MATIKGVNLGGWFVLEKWIKPDLFEGVSGPDETVFCKEKTDAKQNLQKHWDTFIVESDFAYIKERGINSVRIPIPWWTFVETNTYFNSLMYIDRAMEWAKKYQLKVLLDLHTAPGCQNGFDNGGITGVIDWPKDQGNIDLTVEVLEKIAIHFKSHEALWGIEVLNEPHYSINLDLIQSFYLRAYNVIRKHLENVAIVFHDGFRPLDPSWENFFTRNNLHNVAFDLHIYHCFNPVYEQFTLENHITEAFKHKLDLVERVQKFVRVIVGEWSLGIHHKKLEDLEPFQHNVFLTIFGNAQLYAYESGYGWYFWNYKIERSSHLNWDFRRLLEKGILPNKY